MASCDTSSRSAETALNFIFLPALNKGFQFLSYESTVCQMMEHQADLYSMANKSDYGLAAVQTGKTLTSHL